MDSTAPAGDVRVLVTGGAGFVGSHFVRDVLADRYDWLAGAAVTVLDKLTYAGQLSNLGKARDSPRFTFVAGDICRPDDLDLALPGTDLVVNFAAETHVDRSIQGHAGDFVQTNVAGVQTLLEACLRHGRPRVVHVSTDEVYGSISEGAWTEDAPVAPNSPYAASKAAGDLLALAFARTYGLDVRITRSSNTFGPHQLPDKLLPKAVTNLLDGRPVPLYGDGGHVRSWLWVGDHCRAIALVAARGGADEVYNVGGGREMSNRELVAILLAATGRDWSDVAYVADPRAGGHDRRYRMAWRKLAALGYQPETSFDDALERTVAWYRDNETWWRPLHEHAAGPPDR